MRLSPSKLRAATLSPIKPERGIALFEYVIETEKDEVSVKFTPRIR